MLKPIEEVVKAVEDNEEKPLPPGMTYQVVMYLEMLHDLMCDTAYYYGRYVESNLSKERK